MAMKYTGDGSFVLGVPARDLTDAEVHEYAGILRASLSEKDPMRQLSDEDLLLETGAYQIDEES